MPARLLFVISNILRHLPLRLMILPPTPYHAIHAPFMSATLPLDAMLLPCAMLPDYLRLFTPATPCHFCHEFYVTLLFRRQTAASRRQAQFAFHDMPPLCRAFACRFFTPCYAAA